MASTYTTGFGIEKIGDGEQAGAWGTTTNHNLDIIDRIASYKAVGLSGTTHTLTIREASPESGTENLQDGMYRVIKFTGALGANNTVTIAPNTSPAWFIIENATTDSGSSGPYSVILTQGSGANITVLNGKNAAVYCDGAGSGAAIYDAFADLQVATLDASGDITGSTLNADGDTAAGDNAAIGYTSAEGLILTGQGSTNDVTIKNDADADVITIATGATNVDIVGDLTAGTLNADGDTSAGDNATIGYTSAEGLILTGQGSTSDITVKNDADETVFTVPTGTDDILFPDDAKAMWGTGSDLQVYHDGSNSYIADSGTGNLKLKGSQIDIQDTSGNDDFSFTANNLNILSGSTLTIDSGATITNSGTATGFGADAERAFSGVLQTNANFVDQVIFGPAVDGRPWNGLWNKASVFSSLMLATVESTGGSSELNVWDLTEQSSGAPSTTPLYTQAIGWTSTSIDAAMGYVVIGGDAGVKFYDPHSGAWAQRTVGWPRYLTNSSVPALNVNDIQGVAAGLANQSPIDIRTGGPMPVFAVTYVSGGSKETSVLKYGSVYHIAGDGSASGNYGSAIVAGGRVLTNYNNDQLRQMPADQINADVSVNPPYMFMSNEYNSIAAAKDCADGAGSLTAIGSGEGLTLVKGFSLTDKTNAAQVGALIANMTRAYNTGFLPDQAGSPIGVWLANSNTADRGYRANTLTQNGSITAAAVASGAELQGYSAFSATINMSRASDSDWDEAGTGTLYMTCWVKRAGGATDNGVLMGFSNSGRTIRFMVYENANGFQILDDGATANVNPSATVDGMHDGAWHKLDFVRVSSTERYAYWDGDLIISNTTDAGSLSSSGNLPFYIGVDAADGSSSPATDSTLALVRLFGVAPNAEEIRQMYASEIGLFQANAECLLQSGTTDAVLDVSVDPLSESRVLVTQTDAITIFENDGLVVESKPTVNSGNSEKGKLWGNLRSEQNSANAYMTAPATDQRQINEMVRGLASDLPSGIDLSEARAWINFDGTGTVGINGAFNIKSLTDNGTGDYTVTFAVPFKNTSYVTVGGSKNTGSTFILVNLDNVDASRFSARVSTRDVDSTGGTSTDADPVFVVFFGELENE
jgi:hypothetical protein